MKSASLILCMTIGLLLASSCKSTKSQPATESLDKNVETAAPAPQQTQPACKALVEKSTMPKSDLVDQVEASINGDCLDLNLTFGGGCNEHLFDLYWDGSFMKSFPPQVNLRLFHDKKGDACKAIVEQKASFDLKPIQNGGEVVINLYVDGNETQTLTYKE